jgi:hypothetical protein
MASALAAFVLAAPAHAVEYRLQVVSVYEKTFFSYLKPGELSDGATGVGLDNLEASFDRGQLPAGGILFDRRALPVDESIVRAYGGTPVVATFVPGGGSRPITWDEITWEGKPGERAVWGVSPILRSIQELERVALKTTGKLRQYRVYTLPPGNSKLPAAAFPLNFLWALEERGTAWDKYVARGLDLQNGVGVVVGINTNAMFADQAYVIVNQGDEPTTSKVVLVWRERNVDRQLPGFKVPQ